MIAVYACADPVSISADHRGRGHGYQMLFVSCTAVEQVAPVSMALLRGWVDPAMPVGWRTWYFGGSFDLVGVVNGDFVYPPASLDGDWSAALTPWFRSLGDYRSAGFYDAEYILGVKE